MPVAARTFRSAERSGSLLIASIVLSACTMLPEAEYSTMLVGLDAAKSIDATVLRISMLLTASILTVPSTIKVNVGSV